MRIIERFRRRRKIRALVRVLPHLLKKRYGKHKKYTEGQVKMTLEAAGFDESYRDFACAIYMGRQAFEKMQEDSGQALNYDELRQEVADQHFSGDADFTVHDAFDAAKESQGLFGGSSEFDDGGGDVGDGDAD